MVGSGMLDGLNGIFNFFIGCFIVAILGCCYGIYTVWDLFYGDVEIVSHKRIVPELRLTVIENKVDTLYIYKQDK